MQLLKQLSPGFGTPELRQRYWDLLALCLLIAPPGTGVEDFVHAFAHNHAPDAVAKKRLISQLHKGRYGESLLTELPTAENLNMTARAFFGLGGRKTTRFSQEDLITAKAVGAAVQRASAADGTPAHLTPPSMPERVPDLS